MVNQEARESMQKLVTGMIVDKGFTLIEILIVIVIIGITIGFALIAFGDFGSEKRIIFSAEQLSTTLKMAQQQAILESSTLGLKINAKGYELLKFNNAGVWNPVSKNALFKFHYFPENTVVHIEAGKHMAGGFPEIIINSTGDMTPFNIKIGTSQNDNLAVLSGSHNGIILVKKMLIP